MTGGGLSSNSLTLLYCIRVSSVYPCCSVLFLFCWSLSISSYDDSFLLLMLDLWVTSFLVSVDIGRILITCNLSPWAVTVAFHQFSILSPCPCVSCSSRAPNLLLKRAPKNLRPSLLIGQLHDIKLNI